MKLRLALQLLGFFHWVFAESTKGSYEQTILFSCQSSLGNYKFGCHQSSWECTCAYQPFFESIIQCINTYLPKSASIVKANKNLVSSCEKYGGVNGITIDSINNALKNSTTFLTDPEKPGFNKSELLYVPILPLANEVIPKLKDYRAFLGNFDTSQNYGVIINLFWIICLLWFGMVNKLKKTRFNNKLVSKEINWVRSKFTLPLVFGRHAQPLNYFANLTSLLPSSSEALVLVIYITLNIILLFHGFQIYRDNSIFGPNLIAQFSRYLADRSGILAFAHFPLLIIFAGRNNILISLSGLTYGSFMVFHKWTARIMVFDAVIHSFAYFAIMVSSGSLPVYLKTVWLQTGILATLTGVSILLFAIHNFRVKYYELFLVTHIGFAILFFYSCWEHCMEFGWLEWISGALVIWGIDRIWRLYKLIKFGAPFAKIEHISDQTFKVSVPRPHDWNPFPGCFVFIHFLHPKIFWQSHPFTIIDSVLRDEEVTIYIKAKEGLTAKVLEIIGNEPSYMRVSLEGPYGNQSTVDSYGTVLLFAGGNGIPGPFYHSLHLVQKPLVLKQRVKLIWVVRQVESIRWFEEELLKLMDTNIECDIYITRNFDADSIKAVYLLNQFNEKIRFYSGRAPIIKILSDEFNNAKGSIGIVTCGPPIMCDEIREFVSMNLNQCKYRVDLFEELQVW